MTIVLRLEQGVPGFEPPLEGAVRSAIIEAATLSEDDMLAGLPIQVATTGHSKVMIPLEARGGPRRPFP